MTPEERAAAIAEKQDRLDRLKFDQTCASMSDSRYYINGRKDRDDSDIRQAKAELAALEAVA